VSRSEAKRSQETIDVECGRSKDRKIESVRRVLGDSGQATAERKGYGNLEKVEPGRRGAEKAKMAMGYGDGDNEEENRKEKEEKTPEQGETTRR
jgi:DNA-binding winged helix-turn-helix (wHTH) protein